MKKAHFIGICGAGMSAVAKLLADSGWRVSGSDENFYPPVSTYLEDNKIPFKKGYNPDNIPENVDLIIIGKHAGLTEDENEEVKMAFLSGVPIKSFAQVLGELSANKNNVVVAGSYGKSTCAALIAWCLECSGKDPSYFIGAIPNTPPRSAKIGNGDTFVIEGDEYPSSNWDNSSKFLHYHPNHLLLTSLEHDHFNIFKTPDDYNVPFLKLLLSIPKDGSIVGCTDGLGVREALLNNKLSVRSVLYSVKNNADWQISNLTLGEVSSFDILNNGKTITQIKTSLLGMHNIENILGTGALILSLKLITPDELSSAISSFKALNRRLDKKSNKTSIPMYEGFGSSYVKARSAIEAIKLHFPDKKLIILFEPHAFSWRDKKAISWYDDVFNGADKVFIYKSSDDSNTNELSLTDIVSRVKESGYPVDGFTDINKGLEFLSREIDNNSLILTLSSGSFGDMIESIIKYLEDSFPS